LVGDGGEATSEGLDTSAARLSAAKATKEIRELVVDEISTAGASSARILEAEAIHPKAVKAIASVMHRISSILVFVTDRKSSAAPTYHRQG
jgi:hypothetical protein